MRTEHARIVSECILNIRNATLHLERVQITLIETMILNRYSFRNNHHVFQSYQISLIFSMKLLKIFSLLSISQECENPEITLPKEIQRNECNEIVTGSRTR